MGTAVKIGVIGAGSAVFSLGLVRDLCLKESLSGSTVTFMDVDQRRLEMIHRLASRYADELGADVRFEETLDRRVALREADFVINTAARGHDDEEAQRSVGEAHGYYRGVRMNFHNLSSTTERTSTPGSRSGSPRRPSTIGRRTSPSTTILRCHARRSISIDSSV